MARFRKIATEVDAVQWKQGEELLEDMILFNDPNSELHGKATLKTAEGRVFVQSGDWIVTTSTGDKFCCKPAEFAEIYKEIPDGLKIDTVTDTSADTLPDMATSEGPHSGTTTKKYF